MHHETNLRSLLIKLQDSLSDSDRCRLHFLFGNVIPRKLRDDPSINGTLHVIESLFDRGLIDDQDFSYLIQAFREIHRPDIAKRLKAHAESIKKNDENSHPQSTEIQNTNEIIIEEDKVCSFNGQKKSDFDFQSSNKHEPKVTSNMAHVYEYISMCFQKKFNKWTRYKSLILLNILSIMIIVALLSTIAVELQSTSNIVSCESQCNQGLFPSIRPIVLTYFHAVWTTERNSSMMNINGDKITHINYAFATIDSNDCITLRERENQTMHWKQWLLWKKKYPHVRTIISVGGDIYQDRFKNIIVNNQTRSTFATSCLEFIQKYDFDGIDLDWRNPLSDSWPNHSGSLEDKRTNFILLLKEIRRQLDTVSNRNYILTIAIGVNPEHIPEMGLSSLIMFVDWINVITYDFHHYHEARTNHNAPLYQNQNETLMDMSASSYRSKLNSHAAIQACISAGVPSLKITMGIPLYGIGWQGVKNHDWNGLFQAASNEPPNGTWGSGGDFDYTHLKREIMPLYERYWDDQSKVPFLFNRTTAHWISYEDLESLKWKTHYIKQHQLAGIFFWEITKDQEAELISAAFNSLIKDRNASSIYHCC